MAVPEAVLEASYLGSGDARLDCGSVGHGSLYRLNSKSYLKIIVPESEKGVERHRIQAALDPNVKFPWLVMIWGAI